MGFIVFVALFLLASPTRGQGVVEYSHGEPTDYEQLMLELVNEARANPPAEAEELGIDLNQGLAAGRIGPEPKAPLAFHPQLIEAARNHSDWMLASDVFSHTGSGGSTPTQRAAAAGYPFGVAENIAYYSRSANLDFLAATEENHEGLFKSPGHRVNLMEPSYTVVGLGVRRGDFNGYDTQMVSQSFSTGGDSVDSGPFLLGVVYDDKNGNGFYDVGEGLPGVRVEPDFGGYYAVTSASGGYAVPLPPVGTVSETVNLPFAVGNDSWEQARPYDEAFRHEKIQSADDMTLRILWSGAAIGGAVRSAVAVKRPVAIDYRLMGTNNMYFPLSMVAAENVKVDFSLQNPPPPLLERVVRFAGNMGEFDIELFGLETPLTVRNFLNYVESGRYDGSFVHRSVPRFVIQGGGFGVDGSLVVPVTTDPEVPNEPGISNLRGTVAMAKIGNDPNSATSQWFINLADNSENLDNQNGGFTVFGRVLGNGMAVADRVAGLRRVDLRANFGGAFGELPLLGDSATVANLVRFAKVLALPEGTVVREYDFSGGDQGFAGGFADLPSGYDPALYNLVADHRDLPAELGGGKGLFISGTNRSGDLWMFGKKKLTGLLPNTVYEVAVDLEMASNVVAGLAGIGGAPGESVFVKAGASTMEPGVAVDSAGWLRSNVDKGNQSGGGVSASVLGDVAKENDASENFARLSRDNRSAKRSVVSGADGSLWIFFGTDSGFEGTTSLYYTKASVVLVPRGGGNGFPGAPSISSANEAGGMVGIPFSYQIAASNNPDSLGASGLPGGLTFNATSGLISGTPLVAGNFTVVLTATNAEGTGEGALVLTIATAPEQPAPEQPAPEQPTPEQPTPEQPTPEQPTPEQPTPEQPTPEQPAPEQPAVVSPAGSAPSAGSGPPSVESSKKKGGKGKAASAKKSSSGSKKSSAKKSGGGSKKSSAKKSSGGGKKKSGGRKK